MALPATTILEVQTGGSDTACAGGFDPESAGMLSNGTVDANTGNTSAPVFSSASYNFVAGDVGAWLFVKSGTNTYPGWYQIASVASNKATLGAAIGSGRLYSSVAHLTTGMSTAVGIASSATPSSITFTVDYSQNAAAIATGTATSATTTLTATSAIFTPVMVGNVATDATTYVTITGYTSTTIVTVNASPSFSAATIYVGGALGTPGKAGAVKAVAGMDVFIKNGTHSATSATANIAGGMFSDTTGGATNNPSIHVGYGTNRWFGNTDTKPLYQASGSISSFTMVSVTGTGIDVWNMSVDAASKTTSTGITLGTQYSSTICHAYRCKAANTTVRGIYTLGYNDMAVACEVTGASGTAAFASDKGLASFSYLFCEAHDNTIHGFKGDGAICCIADTNTGGSTDGFNSTGASSFGDCISCISYANGRHGYNVGNNGSVSINNRYVNCIAEGNSGYGWSNSGNSTFCASLLNCAAYNNTSGTYNTAYINAVIGFITQTAGSYFTNAAGGDFSTNNTSGQGALLRAAGFPNTFPAGTTASYDDIGAAQHQDTPSTTVIVCEDD